MISAISCSNYEDGRHWGVVSPLLPKDKQLPGGGNSWPSVTVGPWHPDSEAAPLSKTLQGHRSRLRPLVLWQEKQAYVDLCLQSIAKKEEKKADAFFFGNDRETPAGGVVRSGRKVKIQGCLPLSQILSCRNSEGLSVSDCCCVFVAISWWLVHPLVATGQHANLASNAVKEEVPVSHRFWLARG